MATDRLTQFRLVNRMAADGSDDFEDFSGNGTANISYFAFGFDDVRQGNLPRATTANIGSAGPFLPTLLKAAAGSNELLFAWVQPADPGSGVQVIPKTTTDLKTYVNMNDLSGSGFFTLESVTPLNEHYELVVMGFEPNEARRFFQVEVKIGTGSP